MVHCLREGAHPLELEDGGSFGALGIPARGLQHLDVLLTDRQGESTVCSFRRMPSADELQAAALLALVQMAGLAGKPIRVPALEMCRGQERALGAGNLPLRLLAVSILSACHLLFTGLPRQCKVVWPLSHL